MNGIPCGSKTWYTFFGKKLGLGVEDLPRYTYVGVWETVSYILHALILTHPAYAPVADMLV